MLPGTKTAIFPRKYIQGPGVLTKAAKLMSIFMKKPLIMGGRRALAAVEKAGLFKALEEHGAKPVKTLFGDAPWGPECCEPEIDRLVKIGQENNCDGVIAVGGGKAIDTGKAVANKMGVECIIVPTIAATDAPTSALSVIYTTEHVFKEYWFFDVNPLAVIVDTKVIAQAPPRYLAGGMGDAGSKKFEAESVVRAVSKNLAVKPDWIGTSTEFTLYIAKGQYDMLLRYGELAMASNRAKAVTPALEAIVETNILWSGIAFESSGLSIAHSIHDGLTLLEHLIPEEKRPIHGELVNFGTIVQLIMEDYPTDVLVNHMIWSHKVGLPITFEELGFKPGEPSDEDLWKAAEKATAAGETLHASPLANHGAKEVGPYKHIVDLTELVFYSMKLADEYGKKVAKEVPRVPYDVKWEAYMPFKKH